MIETINISVGRGTPTPFEHIGARYIDAHVLAAYLTAQLSDLATKDIDRPAYLFSRCCP